jgi:arylsulfatase A-like enzyme
LPLALGFAFVAPACSRPAGHAGADPVATASAPATVASAPPPAASAAAPARLSRTFHVLLVMIDSLRGDVPWTGYPRAVAPRLTELEKRCVTYTRAYALSSYTAKSVAPALAGLYPTEMKRDGYFFTRWLPENLLVSERLQAAGHRSFAGHAHGYFEPRLGMGMDQGFSDYRMIPGAVDLRAVTSVTSEPLTVLARQMLSDPRNVALPEGKRFFGYFHYLDPHHTYERHPGHPDFGSKARDLYDHEVHYTDRWVGELLDWVDRQPWAAETAIIVTSDHGEGFGERGHFRHAYELWESLIRVPLLFRVPGVAPRRIDARRSHLDLAPTIADLMGVAAEPPFRGRSLVPELLGAPAEPRRIVADLPRADLMDRRRAVIDGGWKIVGFGDDRSFQLFHVDEDPWEVKELSKQEPARLEAMKRIYAEESARIENVPVVGGVALKGAPGGRRW